jgi:hypothetical protein
MRGCIELRNLVSLSSPYLTIHTTIHTTIDAIDVDNTIVDTIVVIV